ncbi:MAG: acyl-ACP--UDP-N-acetylglucosamine O-acyltransferase [Telmatospirillum sp.]|nr:acyl-ACP--UDP-N-acetylglucosamine O-acyltransferase [Telmatospirillum sp.]
MASRLVSSSAAVHPTAIVENGAVIGEGCRVGPYSVIGDKVRLGAGNQIASHVVISGRTVLGDGNRIFPFAVIGSPPQDLKWQGEESLLIIGDRNIIREYATLQPGTAAGAGRTVVGNDTLLMAHSHVAHDCRVGSHVHLVNSATLGGHVDIDDGAILSGLCAIHQFVRIGRLAFVAGGAMVAQDVPPFCTVQGDRARLAGLNLVGLTRAGMPAGDIRSLKAAYRMLFLAAGPLPERLKSVRDHFPDNGAVGELAAFVAASHRGVALPRRTGARDAGSGTE